MNEQWNRGQRKLWDPHPWRFKTNAWSEHGVGLAWDEGLDSRLPEAPSHLEKPTSLWSLCCKGLELCSAHHFQHGPVFLLQTLPTTPRNHQEVAQLGCKPSEFTSNRKCPVKFQAKTEDS